MRVSGPLLERRNVNIRFRQRGKTTRAFCSYTCFTRDTDNAILGVLYSSLVNRRYSFGFVTKNIIIYVYANGTYTLCLHSNNGRQQLFPLRRFGEGARDMNGEARKFRQMSKCKNTEGVLVIFLMGFSPSPDDPKRRRACLRGFIIVQAARARTMFSSN